jgi:hypothetical protein
MAKNIHQRCVERAAEIAGSEKALAAALNVTVLRVRLWKAGGVQLPGNAFLQCVDIILQATVQDTGANEPGKSNRKKCG